MKKTGILFLLFLVFGQGLVLAQSDSFAEKLAGAAVAQTKIKVRYTPDYVNIPYPNGDVPAGTGVCTDLVIRAFRTCEVDLQKSVHEDMKKNFSLYPHLWQMKKTDTNIDHRRVPNLMKFFERQGWNLKLTKQAGDYKPGDVVAWNLGNRNSATGITHIGIISDIKSGSGCYLVAHNIGAGNELEDMLFDYTIIGHYRIREISKTQK